MDLEQQYSYFTFVAQQLSCFHTQRSSSLLVISFQNKYEKDVITIQTGVLSKGGDSGKL